MRHLDKFLSIALTAIIFFLLPLAAPRHAGAGPESWLQRSDTAIVVSQKIRPYLAALDGATKHLQTAGNVKTDFFTLSDYPQSKYPSLLQDIAAHNYKAIIAIGPEAALFLTETDQGLGLPPIVFTMLLNPEKIIGSNGCGIFLNIPIAMQIEKIGQVLPCVKKIAILYDPAFNGGYVKTAAAAAAGIGLEIVPLEISSKQELPRVLDRHWSEMDAIWFIPDQTVISESIVSYIIKEAFIHNIPTIGYNSFFSESGALLSFVFDYEQLGAQAASLSLQLMKGEACPDEPPRFRLHLNPEVMRKLSVPVSAPPQAKGDLP
ncbi:MAG: hypothetical protein HY885_06460 [Deltaproteobacteria bacterium]|nr:hypothetical protein [Deltaproteobacteria bacterium]